MNEFLTMMDRSVFLMQVVGGAAAGIFLCYSGYLFLASAGDPQGVARGRSAFFGVLVGLLILGFATVVPRVFSQVVLEPSGGTSLTYFDSRLDCDGTLQRQLVLQRQVNDATRVNYLIAVIQAKNDYCSVDNWNPEAENSNSGRVAAECVAASGAATPTVGRLQVPPGLRVKVGGNTELNFKVHRDGSNNMVVHFKQLNRPTGGAACWVYFSRYDAWRFGRLS